MRDCLQRTCGEDVSVFTRILGSIKTCLRRYCARGGHKPMGNPESPKFDGCPMDSHFIGHGLLRTVFKITLARPEGSTPATIVSTNTKILKNHQNNFILLFFWPPLQHTCGKDVSGIYKNLRVNQNLFETILRIWVICWSNFFKSRMLLWPNQKILTTLVDLHRQIVTFAWHVMKTTVHAEQVHLILGVSSPLDQN